MGMPYPARQIGQQLTLAGFEKCPLPRTYVVLATAHFDQDPGNNHPRNLAARCQKLPTYHDRTAHRRQCYAPLFYRRALGDLFGGPYLHNDR